MTPSPSLPRSFHLRPELERLPRYIPGLSAEDVKQQAAVEPVKLSSNENPLGPSPRAVEAMQRAAWEIHRYPDPACRKLREALSRKWSLPPEQIVVANGGDNLITLLAQVMLGPGQVAVVPAVTFATYEIASRLSGARVEKVPMDGPAIDVDAMARALAAGARLAFVCNPNNPTGTMLTAREMERLVESVPDGAALVIDEAYVEFVSRPDCADGPALVRQGAPVVVLRTFSKVYGLAGLRVGYALAPRPIADAMWRAREAFATSRVAEAAALAALEDQAHVERTLDMVVRGRRQLYELLDGLGLGYVPSEANFVWVRTGVPSGELVPALARRGVLVRPGDFWGQPEYIRVTVGTPAQNRRFVEALQEALRELSAWPPTP